MLQNKGNTAERLLKWHLFSAATVDGIGRDIVWRLWFIGSEFGNIPGMFRASLKCSRSITKTEMNRKYEKLFS